MRTVPSWAAVGAATACIGALLSACGLAEIVAGCEESGIAETDRQAAHVWEALGSSEDPDGAYCDSSPYPYASGRIPVPADVLIERAQEGLGCATTSEDGFDDSHAQLLACAFDGNSYLLEITTELDRYAPPGTEVGLYKR